MTVGERIQELRKKKGYSQEKLASYLNMSRQAVAKWEQNICEPSLDCLVSMAKLFEVDLNYLVLGETKKEDAGQLADTGIVQKGNILSKKDIILLISLIIFIGIFIGCFIYAVCNPIYFNQKSSFIWWYVRFWVSSGIGFRILVLISIIGIIVSLKKFCKKG